MEAGNLLELQIREPRDALDLRRELRALGLHLGAEEADLHQLCTATTRLVRRLAGAGGGAVAVRLVDGHLQVRLVGVPKHVVERERSSLPPGCLDKGDVVFETPLPVTRCRTSPPARPEERQSLQRLRGELQRVSAALGHDLKAPVHTIQVYAKLLTEHVRPSGAEHVDQILASCDRLLGMLDGLLERGRTTHTTGRTHTRPIDPAPALLEAIQNLDPDLRQAGAVLQLSSLPPLPVAHVHLVQIFQNLLSNSLKYRCHRPPEIHVRGAIDADGARIRYTDNGRGIPGGKRDWIFEPFARLARDRDQQGAGVGLALVADLITGYGGRIRVDPSHQAGTAFVMEFPLEPAD